MIGSTIHACDSHMMTLKFFFRFYMSKPTKAVYCKILSLALRDSTCLLYIIILFVHIYFVYYRTLFVYRYLLFTTILPSLALILFVLAFMEGITQPFLDERNTLFTRQPNLWYVNVSSYRTVNHILSEYR